MGSWICSCQTVAACCRRGPGQCGCAVTSSVCPDPGQCGCAVTSLLQHGCGGAVCWQQDVCLAAIQLSCVRDVSWRLLWRGEGYHTIQPHDSKDWTHQHCCFHTTIHGLIELGIFKNKHHHVRSADYCQGMADHYSLSLAAEPETEDNIDQWAIQRQSESTHTGSFDLFPCELSL